MADDLTFSEFSETNRSRAGRWHPDFGPSSSWTGADWSNAMCGEAGEAANVVKKLRRIETGADPGPTDPPHDVLLAMLGDEIADTVTYADLLAQHYGIDLGAAVTAKFDRISERQGFPERLGSPQPAGPSVALAGAGTRSRATSSSPAVDLSDYFQGDVPS